MSAERVLVSYIIRVAVRGGKRGITLHEVGSDVARLFGSYGELVDYLGVRESSLGRMTRRADSLDDPRGDSSDGAGA